MPALAEYSQGQIDAMEIEELGVRDGASPNITFDRSGSIATRRFRVAWPARYDFCRFMLGDVSFWIDGVEKKLTRLVPQKLPTPPDLVAAGRGLDRFVATKLAEPIRGYKWVGNDPEPDATEYVYTDGTINRFLKADVTVQYEKTSWEALPDAGIEEGEWERYTQLLEGGEATPDYLTQPAATQYYLVEGGTALNTPPPHLVPVPFPTGIVDPTVRFRLRWLRIPGTEFGPGTVLWDRLFGTDSERPYIGSVNKTTWKYIPAGRLMLETLRWTYDPSVLADGSMTWDIDFGFAVKPNGGWNKSPYFPNTAGFAAAGNQFNKFLVGRGNTWYATGSIPDGFSNYAEREFADLFSIG